MIKYFIRHYWRYLAMALAFATISFLANGCEVNAETLQSSANLNWSSSTTSQDQTIFNGSGYWANQGRGYLEFNLLLYVYSSGTSRMLPVIRMVEARSDNNWYACNYGSTSLNYDSDNDELKAQMYSVVCDMSMGSTGLERIRVVVDPAPTNAYLLNSSTHMTFSTNVEIDIATRLTNGISNITTQMTTLQNNINNNITNNANAIINNLTNILNTNANRIVDAINSGNTQAHQDAQSQKEATDNINDSINDSTTEDPTNDLNDMSQNETSNSVISDLLLLPINMFQNILNSINGTCSTFNLGSLFNNNLTLPCINIKNYLGNSLYNVIDVIISGLFVLSLRKKFVDIFENITSLKDRGNELE